MENGLPHDAVERVRAIRDRYYEATKHMTFEERWEYDKKRYEENKKWWADVKPDPSRFPFLPQKSEQVTT